MAIFKKKNNSDDGTIDSVEEMVEYEEKKLWEQNPMEALNHNNVEKRKKMNWYARFVLLFGSIQENQIRSWIKIFT